MRTELSGFAQVKKWRRFDRGAQKAPRQGMVDENISRTYTPAAWPSMISEIVIDPAFVFLLSPVFERSNPEISTS
jgi:hypothetical protein